MVKIFKKKKQVEKEQLLTPVKKDRKGRSELDHSGTSVGNLLFWGTKSNKEYTSNLESDDYVTPPTTPEMLSVNKRDSPLNVTVVTTNTPPQVNKLEDSDNTSIAESTISDLTGSVGVRPRSSAVRNRKAPQAEAKRILPVQENVAPTTESAGGNETAPEVSPIPEVNEKDCKTLSNVYCNEATTALVEDFLGIVSCSKDNDDTPVTNLPKEFLPVSTPQANNTNKEWRPPIWGTAPTMEDDTTILTPKAEEETTYLGTNANETTTMGSSMPTASTQLQQKGTAESMELHHDNFELVLESLPAKNVTPKRKGVGNGWKKHFEARDSNAAVMQRAVMNIYNDIDTSVAEEEERSIREEKEKKERYQAVFGVDPDEGKEALKVTVQEEGFQQEEGPHHEDLMAYHQELARGVQQGFEVEDPQVAEKPKKKKWKKLVKGLSLKLGAKKDKENERESERALPVVEAVYTTPSAYTEKELDVNPDEKDAIDDESTEEPEEHHAEEQMEEIEDRHVSQSQHAEEATRDPVPIQDDVALNENDDDDKTEHLLGEDLVGGEGEANDNKGFFFVPTRKLATKNEQLDRVANVTESPNTEKGQKQRTWNLMGRKNEQTNTEYPTEDSNTQKRSSSTPLQSLANTSLEEKNTAKPVKPEWKAVVDENSGTKYYYHRLSRTTTWTKPPGYDEEMAAYAEAKKKSKNLSHGQSVKPSNLGSAFMSAEMQKKVDAGERVDAGVNEHPSILKKAKSREATNSYAFDEPMREEEKKDEYDEEDSRALSVPGSMKTSRSVLTTNTGLSRARSYHTHHTSQTEQTETTQQIRNTRSYGGRSAFESIPEARKDSIDESPGGGKPTTAQVSPNTRSFQAKPRRVRELRVEEFSNDTGFSSKRFGLKAEVYEKDGISRIGRSTSPESIGRDEASSFGPTDDDTDLQTLDTVSELGQSDAEFVNRKDDFDNARRNALDEAIENNDWELAATVAEHMRDTSMESNKPEWTQSEVDQFISQNDWDAVSQYIAKMRDTVVKGLSGPATPPKPSDSKHLVTPERKQNPQVPIVSGSPTQKHFGAKSQLQHDELASVASSWDSVYRSSSESEYESDSGSSYEYRKQRTTRSRRMAT